ncbi:hypothetical protein EC973_000914 [Apophysomyces ossiformis]|uniref:Uncharacterized protein n=1 Tax=Apophysomyces ossiformis TaxID=679940 RepID=A0A8H7BKG9_9FUNG|nr:hypothetical protein EC973_000914 [Apophysomyces ossiformis]
MADCNWTQILNVGNVFYLHRHNGKAKVPLCLPRFNSAGEDKQARELFREDPPNHLLRYNIIPCGYDTIEEPRVDKELYKNLKFDPPLEGDGLFQIDREKADRFLASHTVDEFDSASQEFMSNDPKNNFIHNASQIMYAVFQVSDAYVTEMPSVFSSANIFRKCRIQESEFLYKYKVLWPLLELVASTASSEREVLMTPGETPLLAMNSDNKGKEDNRCVFNVDGTLRVDTLDKAEMLTLEVTGAYGFKDRSRCGYDHVKGAFSCLAMLRKLAHAYYAAGFEIFSKLRMYFLHVKERKVKLWAVYTPEPEVNLLQLVKEAEFPGSFDGMDKVVDLLDFWWELVVRVENVVRTIEKLKKEHTTTLRRAHVYNEPLPDLRIQVNEAVVDLVKKDTMGMQHCAPKSPPYRI